MNKKGFTLVELLAVITLLGLIGAITIPAVASIIRNSRKDIQSVQYDTILNGAYDCVQQKPYVCDSGCDTAAPVKRQVCKSLPKTNDEEIVIEVDDIIKSGILKDDMKDSEGNLMFGGGYKVIVKYFTSAPTLSEEEDKVSKFFGNYLFTVTK